MKIEAPIKVSVKVIVVSEEDKTSGEVTYDMPVMQMPTRESIIEAINEVSESDILKQNGMRLANQKETFDYIMRERTGHSDFAMPKDVGEWFK